MNTDFLWFIRVRSPCPSVSPFFRGVMYTMSCLFSLQSIPVYTCMSTSFRNDRRPIDGPDCRVPVMALAARHAFDGAVWQAWGTVHKWRSQRRVIGVLNPRPVPMSRQADDWVISACSTSSAPFCPLYANRVITKALSIDNDHEIMYYGSNIPPPVIIHKWRNVQLRIVYLSKAPLHRPGGVFGFFCFPDLFRGTFAHTELDKICDIKGS